MANKSTYKMIEFVCGICQNPWLTQPVSDRQEGVPLRPRVCTVCGSDDWGTRIILLSEKDYFERKLKDQLGGLMVERITE